MLAALEQRRSIREYRDEPVPLETIHRLIEAATTAPSPFNLQPWRFHIVADLPIKTVIRETYDVATRWMQFCKKVHLTDVPVYIQDTSFLQTATLIVPCYLKKVLYARDALAMAVENLMLEAASQSIATVCMGRITTFGAHRKKIAKAVAVDKDYAIPYLIALGYPKKPYDQYEKPPRKSVDEVVRLRKSRDTRAI